MNQINKKTVILFGAREYPKLDNPIYDHDYLAKALLDDSMLAAKVILRKNFLDKNLFSEDTKAIISLGIATAYPILLKKLGLVKARIIHSWNDDYHKCGGFGGPWLRKKVEYWIVKNADLNITCSKYRLKKSKELGNPAIFIPHGVIKEYDKIKPKKLAGDIKIVYGGELSKRKGTDKIILLAKRYKNSEVVFYLLGHILPDAANLFKELPKNVIYKGSTNHKDLIGFYKSADILIHPTDNDSTLKIQEYIKAKKAIIAIDGQIRCLLEHNKNAYITDNLEIGLDKLIDNRRLRERLAKNVKKIKTMTWDEVMLRYAKAVKDAINKP